VADTKVPTKKLIGVDDFGIIQRGLNDVQVCGLGGAFNHAEKCKIIDDAVVFLRSTPAADVTNLMDRAATSSPYFPNTPPGRLPDFYRVIVASRLFQQKAGKPPTLLQLLTILDLIEDARGRDDDYAMLDTATRAVLKYKLTPVEQSWADERLKAIEAAANDVSAPPASSSSSGGGGALAAAAALGTGGFFVGGPVGAAVGAVVGLVVGAKK
jgi:hypothetical protein